MSLSLTFSSISSDSDYEDDYPIRKSYKDEPFFYDGISDEELHSHLNREFEERVNWIKYGVCFSSENRLHDDGGDYIIYEPYDGCDIVDTNIHGDFSVKEKEFISLVTKILLKRNTLNQNQKVFLIQ